MRPYVSIITLGVPDVSTARRFYVDGLGWPVVMEVPGEVVFVRVGHGVALALWGAEDLAADIGPGTPVGDPSQGAMALAHNVGSDEAVGGPGGGRGGRGHHPGPAAPGDLRRPPGLLRRRTRPATGGRSPTTPRSPVADDGSITI